MYLHYLKNPCLEQYLSFLRTKANNITAKQLKLESDKGISYRKILWLHHLKALFSFSEISYFTWVLQSGPFLKPLLKYHY